MKIGWEMASEISWMWVGGLYTLATRCHTCAAVTLKYTEASSLKILRYSLQTVKLILQHFKWNLLLIICISRRFLTACQVLPYLHFRIKRFSLFRPFVIYNQRNVNRMWSHMKGLTGVARRSCILITPLARSLIGVANAVVKFSPVIAWIHQFSVVKPDATNFFSAAFCNMPKVLGFTQCNETRIYLHKTFCFVSGSCCCSSV